MNKEAPIEFSGRFKPFKTKYNLYVFLVCLFFSAAIWFIIKLSKTYELVTEVQIEYVNIPSNRLVIESDTVISATLSASGFKFLGRNLKKKHKLQVDVASLPIQETGPDIFTAAVNINKYIEHQLDDKFGYTVSIVDFFPNQLRIVMHKAYARKVAVRPRISYELAPQHIIYGSIKSEPDSLYIFGRAEEIAHIEAVHTEDVNAGVLNKSQVFNVAIESPGLTAFRLSQNHVNVYIPVEKFTELSLQAPIVAPILKDNKELKLFPDKVQLTLFVALKDYALIKPEHFKILADTSQIGLQRVLPVYVKDKPDNIRIQKINPATVEYIILN